MEHGPDIIKIKKMSNHHNQDNDHFKQICIRQNWVGSLSPKLPHHLYDLSPGSIRDEF